jgi:hypothetical protein
MSSIEVRVAGVAAAQTSRPAVKRITIAGLIARFILTGCFLALSAAIFPLAAIYSFVWWAQH